jgi:hypothetical protein
MCNLSLENQSLWFVCCAGQVLSPFTVDQAVYAKDALAKAIYGRTFTWLVNELNESLANKVSDLFQWSTNKSDVVPVQNDI